MFSRTIVAIALLAGTVVLSTGAHAGGWASVRLAEAPSDPVVGQPWQADLVVKQHDIHEVDVEELSVQFTHQESGNSLVSIGVPTGELGHYLIDVVFDKTGVWNWTATPAPFGPMTMESLQVFDTSATVDLGAPSVTIRTGTCVAPGQELGTLDLPQPTSISDNDLVTGILSGFWELAGSTQSDTIAIILHDAADANTRLACGEMSGGPITAPLVVMLEPEADSKTLGTLSLVPDVHGVTAIVTVMSPRSASGVTIRITDLNEGMFQPGMITVPVGTTVTWQNDSSMGHTVTGAGPGFMNSGMLDHGERFSQTFAEAGTYHYLCDPHGWMTGTITVVE